MPRPSSFARYDEYADPTAAHRRALRAVPAFRSTGTERRVRARSGCTPLIEKLWKLLSRNAITKALTILVLLTVSMAYVVGSTNSPFLYFNF